MSKFVKGFLLVGEVEAFLAWASMQGISWTHGKGIWQCAQIHVKGADGVHNWSPVVRDKNNIISISDDVKLLVQRWKMESNQQYSDTRMLDWFLDQQCVVNAMVVNDQRQFYLSWPHEDAAQQDIYNSPREAIMAQMRAEGQ